MDEQIVQQIFDELLSSLEPLETQNAALLQFLKAKGIATDEELAPFLEQAGNASNVRWLGARVRIRSLISSAMKPAEQPTENESAKSGAKSPEPAAEPSEETDQDKKPEAKVQPEQATADKEKPKKPAADEQGQNKKESGNTNSVADTKKTEENEDAKENVA
jgi:hypothetical protein